MMWKKTVFFCLVISLHYIHSFGVPLPAHSVDLFIHRGIKATIMQNYDLAMTTFDSLKTVSGEDPRPYFYQAAALQARMMDFEDYSEEDRFLQLLDQSAVLAEQWIKIDSLSAMGYFFKGAAISYRGFYYAQRKNYFKGLRDAIVGIKHLNQAVKTDSSYYDAYLGIGTYKYWRSRLTKYFKWLPFFPDQRKEGIRLIEKAVQHGRYGRDVAINGLIWIEIDRRNFVKAINLSRLMQKKYPGSRYFMWPLAAAFFKAGRFAEAIEQYEKLIQSLNSEKKNNHYNEILCRNRIVEAYQKIGNVEQACAVAESALTTSLNPQIRKRLSGKLKKLQKVLRECRDKKIKPKDQ